MRAVQGWLLEVFVVAIMVNSMRWCCSALSFPFICLGSNSASMCSDMLCCYIPGFLGVLVVFFFSFYEGFCSRNGSGACCRSFFSCRSLLALVAHQRQLFRESGSPGNHGRHVPKYWKEGIACMPSEHQSSRWDVSMHIEKPHVISEEITTKSSAGSIA